MSQSQVAAYPGHEKEEETDKTKQAQIEKQQKKKKNTKKKKKKKKRKKSTKISSVFPKRGNRNAKRTEKHKNKITQGKT